MSSGQNEMYEEITMETFSARMALLDKHGLAEIAHAHKEIERQLMLLERCDPHLSRRAWDAIDAIKKVLEDLQK